VCVHACMRERGCFIFAGDCVRKWCCRGAILIVVTALPFSVLNRPCHTNVCVWFQVGSGHCPMVCHHTCKLECCLG